MMSHKEMWIREYTKALDNGKVNPEKIADEECASIESGYADYCYETERDRKLMREGD